MEEGIECTIFSNQHQIWCHRVINDCDGDMLMVFYFNNESNSFGKKK